MQLNLNPASGLNFRFSESLPNHFDGYILRGANVLTATDPEIGLVVQQELGNSHSTIRVYSFSFFRPLRLSVSQPGSFLSSILALRNNLDYQIEGLEKLQLKHGQFALLHTSERPATLHFSNSRTHEFVEISWTKDWLRKLVIQFDFLRSLFSTGNEGKSYFLGSHPKPAGTMALDQVQKILNSPFDDATSRLLFESHTWQYLILILVESAKASNKMMNLTDREQQILESIGEEVSTNHRKDFSLDELGRKANMSGTKFKNAIKQILGTTLGKHKMKARMEDARMLLLDGKFSVKQVAEKVNYKNQNSFSKQFKKHFGYLPTEVDKYK